ncbi:hypothetical protein Tco_1210264 [Tanacetum coccineum]
MASSGSSRSTPPALKGLIELSGETKITMCMKFFFTQVIAEDEAFANLLRHKVDDRRLYDKLAALVNLIDQTTNGIREKETHVDIMDLNNMKKLMFPGEHESLCYQMDHGGCDLSFLVSLAGSYPELVAKQLGGHAEYTNSIHLVKDKLCLHEMCMEQEEVVIKIHTKCHFEYDPLRSRKIKGIILQFTKKSLEKGLKLFHIDNDVYSFFESAEEEDDGLRCSSSTPFTTRYKRKISKSTMGSKHVVTTCKRALVNGKAKMVEDVGVVKGEVGGKGEVVSKQGVRSRKMHRSIVKVKSE